MLKILGQDKILLHHSTKIFKKKKKLNSWVSDGCLNVPQIVISDYSDNECEVAGGCNDEMENEVKTRGHFISANFFGFGVKRRASSRLSSTTSSSIYKFSSTTGSLQRRSMSENFLDVLPISTDDDYEEENEVFEDYDDSSDDYDDYDDNYESENSEIFYPTSTKNNENLAIVNMSDLSSSESETSIDKTKHGLKHLSRSTPTMSPSGSPPHSDSEGQSHVSRRTKKFLRRFRNVPPSERVINYYACAIVSDILWQGTLYITDNYFAFYSNIFGYVNRTLIPINDVSSIRKERTAKFIPNAVGLHTIDGKTIVFSSLISRDATYKFMTHIWKKSRKIDDSDKDINLQVPEEHFLNDSASNSGDSALEDNVDYNEEETYYPPSLPKIGCSSPTEHLAVKELRVETSVTNSENDSSYTTPETGISTSSFMEVQSSIDPLGTSTSENEVRVIRRGILHQKPIQPNSKVEINGQKVEWSVRSAVMENAVNISVAPFRAVKVGLQEITYMPNNSAILIISSGVIFFLLLSAIFMIYRVETLNKQLNADSNQHGDLYEEVLKMQQKLHAATTKEISKTLNSQISQLVTVRQSLEALIFLLDTDHTNQPPQVSEHSYS